ncbi:MAG TPA: hypothetical protein VEI02_06915 [Planctomycetota bacterium]|nr:hypothetical protein [Planctomycetota bacterium]
MNVYEERLLDVLLEEACGAVRSDEIAERVATRIATGDAKRAADAASRARRLRRAAAVVVATLAVGATVIFVSRSRNDGPPPPPPPPPGGVSADNARLNALMVALSFDASQFDPRNEAAYAAAVDAADRAVVDAGELRVRAPQLFAELRPRLIALLSRPGDDVVRRAVRVLVDDEDAATREALATAFERVPAAFDSELILALAENETPFALRHLREFVVENPDSTRSLRFAAALAFDGDPTGRTALEGFLAPGRREGLLTFERQLVAAALDRLGDRAAWRREIRSLDGEVRELLAGGDDVGARRVVAHAETIAELRKSPDVRLRDLRRRLAAAEQAAAGADDPPARLLERVRALFF